MAYIRIKTLLLLLAFFLTTNAQVKKVYDEVINPLLQIDNAVEQSSKEGKFVICQVGGNWCPWCLRLAEYVKTDSLINDVIQKNFVYIHVNYPRRNAVKELSDRLNNPGRFGFPVLVVLDNKGNVLHIQDSSFLEEGKGYNESKILRFLNCWSPQAVMKDSNKKE